MKKGNRRSKQSAEASTADDYEKRVRELEIENKAFQVTLSIFSFSFEFGESVRFLRKFGGKLINWKC